MIFGHHMGEQVLLGSLMAGGTTVATGALILGRAKIEAAIRWLRRR